MPASAAWSYEGGIGKWSFTVPEGLHASVRLPGERQVRAHPLGRYALKKKLP